MSDTQQAAGCPECEGRLRCDGEETVCRSCGLVVSEDRIDRGPEWRGIDEERERTGAPLTRSRHDRGLSTEIGRGSSRMTGRKRRRLARMRRQHSRSQIASKAERNRVHAFTEIARVASALALPEQARDRACILFERAQDADLLRGRSIEGFAAAALYAACRIEGLSRTRTEVAEVAAATVVELGIAYAAMNRNLDLETGPIDPAEYLPRFASELDLPTRVETRAREHLADLRGEGHIAGKDPSGIAAGCLYAAARDHAHPLTQQEAADAADVTPVTLRSTVKAIRSEG